MLNVLQIELLAKNFLLVSLKMNEDENTDYTNRDMIITRINLKFKNDFGIEKTENSKNT